MRIRAVLGHLCFEGLEALPHRFQVMPQPDAADAGWRDGQRPLAELIGDANLPPGWLVDRQGHHGGLDVWRHPILQDRLLPGDLLQRRLAAGFVHLLEPIEAVPPIAYDLAGLGHVAELFGQLPGGSPWL